jgi:hypothetical protein
MSATTLDDINLIAKRGAFQNLGDFHRAKTAYETIFNDGILFEGSNVYTMQRVGTAIPGKVTKSFSDYLQANCSISPDNVRDATLTVIDSRRATPVLSP